MYGMTCTDAEPEEMYILWFLICKIFALKKWHFGSFNYRWKKQCQICL